MSMIGNAPYSGLISGANIVDESIGASALKVGLLSGVKNRIINGDMKIDQRNSGALVTNSNGYTVDRWADYQAGSGRYSFQRTTVAPSGFTNSLLHTVTTAVTPASGDVYQIYQIIEGYNVADFAFGAADAKPLTISFWVRSSLVGKYSLAVTNSGSGAALRGYVSNYTINSANTWEKKTITILGDTTGTWGTANGVGITLIYDLGSGSTNNTTANAWQTGGASSLRRTSDSVNWISTSGNTFYLTGVQLEKGSSATDFEFRPYSAELAMCQRYYEIVSGSITPAIPIFFNRYFRVIKRASPTLALKSGSLGSSDFGAGADPTTSFMAPAATIPTGYGDFFISAYAEL